MVSHSVPQKGTGSSGNGGLACQTAQRNKGHTDQSGTSRTPFRPMPEVSEATVGTTVMLSAGHVPCPFVWLFLDLLSGLHALPGGRKLHHLAELLKYSNHLPASQCCRS